VLRSRQRRHELNTRNLDKQQAKLLVRLGLDNAAAEKEFKHAEVDSRAVDSASVLAYLRARNAYMGAMLPFYEDAELADIQFKRLRARQRAEDLMVTSFEQKVRIRRHQLITMYANSP